MEGGGRKGRREVEFENEKQYPISALIGITGSTMTQCMNFDLLLWQHGVLWPSVEEPEDKRGLREFRRQGYQVLGEEEGYIRQRERANDLLQNLTLYTYKKQVKEAETLY